MSWVGRALASIGLGRESVLERAPKREPRQIIGTLPLSLQVQRIGGAQTPAQVSSILRLADAGWMWQLMDLANEMRQKDCHLQSVLQTREIAIQGLDWQVLAAKSGEKLKHRKQSDFVEEQLRNLHGVSGANGVVGLADAIAHLAAGDYYGHAVLETVWGKDSGKLVPLGFRPIPARRFVYAQEDGLLRWFDANGHAYGDADTAYPGVNLQEEFPGRFIVYQPRITGDVGCREGLVRPLMWAALFRNWTTRDWLTLAELAWKPWRTGTYKKGASAADIANLEAILDAMTSSGVAVYPETTDIQFHWPENSTRGNSAHKELVDAMGSEMSKAVLGQTETTQPTKGGLGGESSNSQHNEVRKDIRDARAKAIAAVIQRDVVAWMIRFNFGQEPASEFRFLTEDTVDQVGFSTMIKNLRAPGVGVRIPQAWVRDQLGIPEPEDGEELVGDGAEDIPIDPATGLPAEPAGDVEPPDAVEEPAPDAPT